MNGRSSGKKTQTRKRILLTQNFIHTTSKARDGMYCVLSFARFETKILVFCNYLAFAQSKSRMNNAMKSNVKKDAQTSCFPLVLTSQKKR